MISIARMGFIMLLPGWVIKEDDRMRCGKKEIKRSAKCAAIVRVVLIE